MAYLTMAAVVKIGAVSTEILAILPNKEKCKEWLESEVSAGIVTNRHQSVEIRTISFEVTDMEQPK